MIKDFIKISVSCLLKLTNSVQIFLNNIFSWTKWQFVFGPHETQSWKQCEGLLDYDTPSFAEFRKILVFYEIVFPYKFKREYVIALYSTLALDWIYFLLFQQIIAPAMKILYPVVEHLSIRDLEISFICI